MMCVFVICLVVGALPQAQDEWTATPPDELLALQHVVSHSWTLLGCDTSAKPPDALIDRSLVELPIGKRQLIERKLCRETREFQKRRRVAITQANQVQKKLLAVRLFNRGVILLACCA